MAPNTIVPDGLHYLSLLDASERIRTGALSPVTLMEAVLDRIGRRDGQARSYQVVLIERARAAAARAAAEIGAGLWRGPLHGIPIAIKDLCETSFAPTTGGMKLRQGVMAATDATVVRRLEDAGAVIIGKLKMTEGAYTSHHPDDPAPLNPWHPDHWVGSSSTGSGVATALGLCFASLGSDTGGSIRFPSATSGLTGIKPSWGRVSRSGILPLAASLDHVGPMARTAADAAAVLGVIAGADKDDPTALPDPVPDYLGSIGAGISGITIGIDRSYTTDGIDPAVTAVLDAAEVVLAGLGARITDVTMPPVDTLLRGWIPFCAVETAIAHRDTYPAQAAAYGPALAQLIDHGHAMSGTELGAIYHERLAFSGALASLFRQVDLLLMPAMPAPVPSLQRMAEYGQDDTLLLRLLRFTAPFNFAGNPTITLPGGFDDKGLPIALQLVGRHLAEDVLCRAGHAFQQRTDWHTRHPPEPPVPA